MAAGRNGGRNFDKDNPINTTNIHCSDPTIPNEIEEIDDEDRWTDLQLAARDGNLANIELLLSDPSTNVNAPPVGWYGQSALQAACAHGHTAVVARLLSAGADPNARGDFNRPRTALQIASAAGNIEIWNMLLATGGDINAPAGKYGGRTALQAAAENGHLILVEKLLAMGAALNTPGCQYGGKTALQAACSPTGSLKVMRCLLSAGADINAPPARYSGLTALQNAALYGNLQMVDELLEAGADANGPFAATGGGTALLAAAECGYAEIVKRLIAAGANIEVVSGERRQTALQAAISFHHTDVMRVLEAAGLKAREGALAQQLDLAKTLAITKSTKINIQDRKGRRDSFLSDRKGKPGSTSDIAFIT